MSSGRAEAIACLIVLVVASFAEARPAVLKERAKFRSGASATTDLIGELQAGVKVEVLADEGGWRQVQTADGQVGYIWAEHLVGEAVSAPPRTDAPVGGDRSVLDEVRDLRTEVHALRERPEPATAGDLERLRDEVQRLVTTQEGLTRRLDQHPATGADPAPETTPGFTPFLLFAAAVVGWMMSRLTQRRREFRQRDRLKF